VPGVRYSLPFSYAENLGRHLNPAKYTKRYCECRFCVGTLDTGEHPLDLLLEDQVVVLSDRRRRQIPTARAVAANTWHYLLSRRLEIQAFSSLPAVEVIERDIDRAAELTADRDTKRLRALAKEVRSA